MTPEDRTAVTHALTDMTDVLNGTGAHADHEQQQIGRCTFCSCGARVQGRAAHPAAKTPSRWAVRLADGFLAYTGPTRAAAEQVAARHPGATVTRA